MKGRVIKVYSYQEDPYYKLEVRRWWGWKRLGEEDLPYSAFFDKESAIHILKKYINPMPEEVVYEET